jgi:hypothetical protein
MGIVQQARRKGANQRVAATRTLEVARPQAELAAAIAELFATWNGAADAAFEASLATRGRMDRWASKNTSPNTRHYFVLERPDRLLVTFGVRAQWVAEHNLTRYGQGWIAQVVPSGSSDNGALRIDVTLLKWTIDDAGRIWNGESYVQLLEGLVAGLDGRYVSDPVNAEDCHFVRRA